MDLRPKLVFLMVSAVFLAVLGANAPSKVASADLAAVLVVFPQTAVPNQTVVLLGTGFTPSTTEGGAAGSGSHQITGIGASVITIDGTPLAPPNVNYPINFDSVGNWAASITVPVTPSIVAGGPIPITVVDDQGLALTTQVIITTPTISLDPASSRLKSDLSITGEGFPASNPATSAGVQVSISYSGTVLTVVSPDFFGEINATVQVPITAAIASNNIVHALIVGFSQVATAIHSVPGPSIAVSPLSGRAGTVVTISGEGFPGNAVVSSFRAGNITVSGSPTPVTDDDGTFVSFFVMPLFSPGVWTITATAGGTTAVNSFTVTEGAAVIQPLPTPQPSVTAAKALEPLIKGDNLIRVWSFGNTSKRWEFFDPRPAFANANTIKTMVPGQVYWLRVNRVQATALNGKAVFLYQGWNLVPW